MICCPLCKATTFRFLYRELPDETEASIVECDQCRHVYTRSERQSNSSRLYDEGVYKIVENRRSIFDWIIGVENNKIIRRIRKHQTGTANLLDFGAGKGKFAWQAKKKRWNVYAVETSAERAAYAREVYGLNVHTNEYEEGKITGGPFNAITLLHVLEHLADPKKILSGLVEANMERTGILCIEVPNFSSLQSKIAGRRWMHLDKERHVSHFTSEQLDKLISGFDLRPVHAVYFSFHLGLLGMTDSLLKKFGYRKNIIFELKNRKPPALIFFILLLLPFSLLMELIAAGLNRGGIIRKYYRFREHK